MFSAEHLSLVTTGLVVALGLALGVWHYLAPGHRGRRRRRRNYGRVVSRTRRRVVQLNTRLPKA